MLQGDILEKQRFKRQQALNNQITNNVFISNVKLLECFRNKENLSQKEQIIKNELEKLLEYEKVIGDKNTSKLDKTIAKNKIKDNKLYENIREFKEKCKLYDTDVNKEKIKELESKQILFEEKFLDEVQKLGTNFEPSSVLIQNDTTLIIQNTFQDCWYKQIGKFFSRVNVLENMIWHSKWKNSLNEYFEIFNKINTTKLNNQMKLSIFKKFIHCLMNMSIFFQINFVKTQNL